MDWKTLLGSAYVEGMTDEEAKVKFDELYMPRSDHDKEVAKQKGIIDSYSAQIAENKRKQREQMSEAERAEAERKEQLDALMNKNKELERTLKISEFTSAYLERGFDKETAFDTATALFDGDTATVFSNEKIFAEKKEAENRTKWEKEYHLNPPAGNGSGKVDFSKQIADAQERGDMVACASYIRQQNEANKQK